MWCSVSFTFSLDIRVLTEVMTVLYENCNIHYYDILITELELEELELRRRRSIKLEIHIPTPTRKCWYQTQNPDLWIHI